MSGISSVARRLVVGVVDRRHESLLLASEDGRLGRVVGMDPVRAHLPQRLEVVAHGSLPIGGRSSRKLSRARLRRDRTVPIGTSSAARDLLVARAPPTRTAAARRAPLRGGAATASATWGHSSSRVERRGDAFGGIVGRGLVREQARGRADAARLAAAVPREQVRRDPVQPRSRIGPFAVVASRASRTRRGTPRRAARRRRRRRRAARDTGTEPWRAGRRARRSAPGAPAIPGSRPRRASPPPQIVPRSAPRFAQLR